MSANLLIEEQAIMPFATVNNARIHYEIQGAGEPLIFLHAGISDLTMWDKQFDIFAAKYRVYRYDLRCYGKTDIPHETHSHVRDLEALFAAWGIEAAYLVGCSIGGITALDFTLLHPDKVKALVMVGSQPSCYPFKGEAPPIVKEIYPALENKDFDKAADLGVHIWVDGLNRKPEQVDAILREQVRKTLKAAFVNRDKMTGEEDNLGLKAIDRLAEIQRPLLIIVGQEDDSELVNAGRLMEAQMPNARLVIMDDTAHVPNMEKPDEFNRIVGDFLAKVAANL
jgi:2-hydroxy-6-oxonona-2,4-dienedioate hydrolase